MMEMAKASTKVWAWRIGQSMIADSWKYLSLITQDECRQPACLCVYIFIKHLSHTRSNKIRVRVQWRLFYTRVALLFELVLGEQIANIWSIMSLNA